MSPTLTKKVAAKKAEELEDAGVETPESQEAEQDARASNSPIWDTRSGRVQGAIWKHDQKGGKVRYTIAIFRSYRDKKTEEWKNVHYFDRDDLPDVEKVKVSADTYLREVMDMVEAA
jgi:hypothetical protein